MEGGTIVVFGFAGIAALYLVAQTVGYVREWLLDREIQRGVEKRLASRFVRRRFSGRD